MHPKQSLAFKSEATETLFGGSAGGGKSYVMRVLALYYAFNIPNIQIFLFRRLSEDLKKNHLDGANGFNAILNDYINAGVVKVNYTTNQIVFDNGAKIHLCHCQYQKDVLKYQGVEINVLFIDELTHFDEYIYKFRFPRNLTTKIREGLYAMMCGILENSRKKKKLSLSRFTHHTPFTHWESSSFTKIKLKQISANQFDVFLFETDQFLL